MKRWFDADDHRDRWYRGLHPHSKLVVDYIRRRCDCAGIWEMRFDFLIDDIGFSRAGITFDWKATRDDIVRLPEPFGNETPEQLKDLQTPRLLPVSGGRWWMWKHIEEQGALPLRAGQSRSDGIMKRLQDAGLLEQFRILYPAGVIGVVAGDIIKPRFPSKRHAAARIPHSTPTPTWEEWKALPDGEGMPEEEIRKAFDWWESQDWRLDNKPVEDRAELLRRWKKVWIKEEHTKNGTRPYWKLLRTKYALEKERREIVATQQHQPDPTKMPCLKPEARVRVDEINRELALVETQMKGLKR